MATTKKDPFLEKIKQYAVEDLTAREDLEGVGSDGSSTNNTKGPLSSLLLPHEWLKINHAYNGAVPTVNTKEYIAILEVAGFISTSFLLSPQIDRYQEIERMSGLPVRPVPEAIDDNVRADGSA